MITFEDGNILDDKYKVICHQVNTLGIMGAGLAKQIKYKYPKCFEDYKYLCDHQRTVDLVDDNRKYIKTQSALLGQVNYVSVNDKLIFNLFAQDRITGPLPRTDYPSLDECLYMVKSLLEDNLNKYIIGNKLAIPYGIGCGLAGGDWDGKVYPLIKYHFDNAEFDTVIVKYR